VGSALLALVIHLGFGQWTTVEGAGGVPDVLAYQGYIEDANGIGLGDTAPVNYQVKFRIYRSPTGSTLVWSEQQNVTFDKGNYSVLLGQGAAVTGEPHPSLSSVMVLTNGSQRWIQTSITIDNNPEVDILPRLQLLASPYALLSTHALTAADATKAESADTAVTVTGSVPASQLTGAVSSSQLADGAVTSNKLAAGSVNASKIGNNVLSDGQIPGLNASKITAGTLADARLPNSVARTTGNNTFTGNQTIRGNLTVTNNLSLGSLGQYKVAVGEENLRIVRGQIKITGDPNIPTTVRGAGFSVDRDTSYKPPGFAQIDAVTRITFTTPFSSPPTVTATLVSRYAEANDTALNYFDWIRVDSITESNAIITCFHPANSGWILLSPFTFTAIGPR